MSKYVGAKCLICEKVFTNNDDVVVCPECGTPYHRDCYLSEGECVNNELHEKNESWKPHYENDEQGENAKNDENADSDQTIKCPRCGEENPSDGLFCKKCGMPLSKSAEQERPFNAPPNFDNQNNNNFQGRNGFYQGMGMSPFGTGQQMAFDQNSDIDGVKLGDYAKYIGHNPVILLSNFIKFGKFGSKSSLNLGALLFPYLYFFYRKMPLIGTIFLMFSFLFSIPSFIEVGQSNMMGMVMLNTHINVNADSFVMIANFASLGNMILRFTAAFLANYWYYKTARKDIIQIREEHTADDEKVVLERISEKGGVSLVSAIVSGVALVALQFLLVFILNTYFV